MLSNNNIKCFLIYVVIISFITGIIALGVYIDENTEKYTYWKKDMIISFSISGLSLILLISFCYYLKNKNKKEKERVKNMDETEMINKEIDSEKNNKKGNKPVIVSL